MEVRIRSENSRQGFGDHLWLVRCFSMWPVENQRTSPMGISRCFVVFFRSTDGDWMETILQWTLIIYDNGRSLVVPKMFLMILDPSTSLGLVNYSQYGAVLLPRASQTALVLHN